MASSDDDLLSRQAAAAAAADVLAALPLATKALLDGDLAKRLLAVFSSATTNCIYYLFLPVRTAYCPQTL